MHELKIVGRLTKNVEVTQVNLKDGELKSKAILSIASQNVGYTNPVFYDIVAWGKQAEIVANLQKGEQVYISAIPSNNNYEADGVKHHSYNFALDKIEFLSAKAKKEEDNVNSK